MVLTEEFLIKALKTNKDELSKDIRSNKDFFVKALKANKDGLSNDIKANRDFFVKELKANKDELSKEIRSELSKEIKDTKNSLLNVMRVNHEMLIDKIDLKIDSKVDEGVNTLKILIEDVNSKVDLLVESRGPLVKRSQKHETVLKNHDKRLTKLEDYTYLKDKFTD